MEDEDDEKSSEATAKSNSKRGRIQIPASYKKQDSTGIDDASIDEVMDGSALGISEGTNEGLLEGITSY